MAREEGGFKWWQKANVEQKARGRMVKRALTTTF
jgi:hypothetical protein